MTNNQPPKSQSNPQSTPPQTVEGKLACELLPLIDPRISFALQIVEGRGFPHADKTTLRGVLSAAYSCGKAYKSSGNGQVQLEEAIVKAEQYLNLGLVDGR